MSFVGYSQYGAATLGLRRYAEESRAFTPGPFTIAEGAAGVSFVFYDKAGMRLGEISSDTESGYVSSAKFALEESGPTSGELILTEPYDPASIDYQTRVDVHVNHAQMPAWSGMVEWTPSAKPSGNKYRYRLAGWVSLLGTGGSEDGVIINRNFLGMELSEIIWRLAVEEIHENLPQINVYPWNIQRVGYEVQDVRFHHVSVRTALDELTELAGDYVYGVNAQREFYFRRRSMNIINTRVWEEGIHVDEADPQTDPTELANKLYLKGGAIGADGTNFVLTIEDADSISAYGLRTEVLTAPTILDPSDVERWGKHKLEKSKEPTEKIKLKGLVLREVPYEARDAARFIDREGVTHDLAVKKIEYRFAPKRIVVDADLGGIIRPLESTIQKLLRRIKTDELLQQSNVATLSEETSDLASTEPRNLLLNSSFEAADAGDVPTLWTAETNVTFSQGTAAETGGFVADGEWTGKMVATTDNVGIYQEVSLDPLTSYVLSVSLHNGGSAATDAFVGAWDVNANEGAGGWLNTRRILMTGAWVAGSPTTAVEFTTTNTTSDVRIYFRVGNTAGTIHVDAAMLNVGNWTTYTPAVVVASSTSMGALALVDDGTEYNLDLASDSTPDFTEHRTLTFDTENADGTLVIPSVPQSVNTSGITASIVAQVLNLTMTQADPITLTAGGEIGLAYNATNLQITASALNTIQDIATASSPTFAGLVISGAGTITMGGDVAFSRTAANLLALAAGDSFSVPGGLNVGTATGAGTGQVKASGHIWTTGGYFIGTHWYRVATDTDYLEWANNVLYMKTAGTVRHTWDGPNYTATGWGMFSDGTTSTKVSDGLGPHDEQVGSTGSHRVNASDPKEIWKSVAVNVGRQRCVFRVEFESKVDDTSNPCYFYVTLSSANNNMNMTIGTQYMHIIDTGTSSTLMDADWRLTYLSGQECVGVYEDSESYLKYVFLLFISGQSGTYYINFAHGVGGATGADVRNAKVFCNE